MMLMGTTLNETVCKSLAKTKEPIKENGISLFLPHRAGILN